MYIKQIFSVKHRTKEQLSMKKHLHISGRGSPSRADYVRGAAQIHRARINVQQIAVQVVGLIDGPARKLEHGLDRQQVVVSEQGLVVVALAVALALVHQRMGALVELQKLQLR